MPLLKHAKKKLKQDKKRTVRNKKVKTTFKLAVKKAKEAKNAKTVSAAFKAIDKAVKKNIIHKNKAARMKSSLSKLIAGSASNAAAAKTTTKTVAAKPAEAKKTKLKSVSKPKATASAKGRSSSGRKKSSSKTAKK